MMKRMGFERRREEEEEMQKNAAQRLSKLKRK